MHKPVLNVYNASTPLVGLSLMIPPDLMVNEKTLLAEDIRTYQDSHKDTVALKEPHLLELRECLGLEASKLKGNDRKVKQCQHAFHPKTKVKGSDTECQCSMRGASKWMKSCHMGQVAKCRLMLEGRRGEGRVPSASAGRDITKGLGGLGCL